MRVQIWIEPEHLMCFVDMDSKDIYSSKLHKLKGQKLQRHNFPHFMIKYAGKKKYVSFDTLWRLANEKLQSKDK